MQGKIKICSHGHKNLNLQTFDNLQRTFDYKELKFFSVFRLRSAVSVSVRSKTMEFGRIL